MLLKGRVEHASIVYPTLECDMGNLLGNCFCQLLKADRDVLFPGGVSVSNEMRCLGVIDMAVEDRGQKEGFKEKNASSSRAGSLESDYVLVKTKS